MKTPAQTAIGTKSKLPFAREQAFSNQGWARGFSNDLLPHLDKPRIRRATGSATVASSLLLAPSPINAQSSIPGFVLRSIDSPHNVALPNIVGGRGTIVPYFLDVDNDGDLDLVHGGKSCSGDIHARWNENVGTAVSPLFAAVESREDLVAPLPAGISRADFDGDGDEDKITFGEGVPYFFENTDTTEEPNLQKRNGTANPLRRLGFKPVAAVDLNGDGYADLIDSEFGLHENLPEGGAPRFSGEASHPFYSAGVGNEEIRAMVFGDLDGDGDFDAFVFEKGDDGTFKYHLENVGDAQTPAFKMRGTGLPTDSERGIFGGIPGSFAATAVFADVDGDGDADAMVGSNTFRNDGSPMKPVFTTDTLISQESFPESATTVSLDIDGDGDLDRLTGNVNGAITLSRRGVSGLRTAKAIDNPLGGFQFSGRPNLSVVDIDGDEDLDLFVADRSHRIFFFENLSRLPQDNDIDRDGLPDAWEIFHFGDIASSDAFGDLDADSLSNLQELAYGTNPRDSDTDRDGVTDAVEFSKGTLPLVVTAADLQTTLSPDSDIGSLRVREVTADMVRLEVHLQLKTPVELLHSTDFIQWTPLDVPLNGADQIQEIILPRSVGKTLGFYTLRLR